MRVFARSILKLSRVCDRKGDLSRSSQLEAQGSVYAEGRVSRPRHPFFGRQQEADRERSPEEATKPGGQAMGMKEREKRELKEGSERDAKTVT